MTDYSQFLVKEYKYWLVQIFENQGYLGRCVIWCKREDALDLADATDEEKDELFVVLRDLRDATKKAFRADWFNYSFLGNETRHLHCHFVPRYESEREFAGMVFKDELWGHHYRTDHDFITPKEVWEKARLQLKELLN